MKGSNSESTSTKEVKKLISAVYDDSPLKDSIFEQATEYFKQQKPLKAERQQLELSLENLQQKILAGNKKTKTRLEPKLKTAQSDLQAFYKSQEQLRQERCLSLRTCCEAILDCSEGDNFSETNKKTARLLGSLRLLSPTEGAKVAILHARRKHLYKAVLCLRLLDRMLIDGNISHPYVINIVNKLDAPIDQLSAMNADNSVYREQIQIPFLMACLLQEVGSCHPEALAIIHGADGELDPFRIFNKEERSKLLKLSYQQSLHYLVEGIGLGQYIGNSKDERDKFNMLEKQKLKFSHSILSTWLKAENGMGNLLKIAQIYTSVVMSTKAKFDYKLLPRAFEVLSKKANEGFYNKVTVDSLFKITGKFPIGYGITYIPKSSDGQDLDRYEYAIVVGLYPADPQVPICRVATKNLLFVSHGNNYNIGMTNNLYYPRAREKLEKVGKERLEEIERLLSSNYKEKKELDYIPYCWHPDDFFSNKKFQNLWNSSILSKL